MSLDLNKLAKNLDEALSNETSESLNKFLNDKRMKNKLKSLAENNAESLRSAFQMNDNSPQPNGIECPKCKEELMDSNPMMTLTSNPPKKNVHCPKCEYSGYRYC